MDKSNSLPLPSALTYKMSPSLWSLLMSYGYIHQIKKNELLFVEKDPATYVYIVLEGCICLTAKRSVIDLVTVGDSIGTTIVPKSNMELPVYPLNAKAISKSKVLKIPLMQYNQLVLSNQECAVYTLEQFRKKMQFVQSMKCFESFSVAIRLANFLLKKKDLLDTQFLTKKIIGQCTGISEATVIRQFSEWTKKNILKVDHRKIDILNSAFLEDLLRFS